MGCCECACSCVASCLKKIFVFILSLIKVACVIAILVVLSADLVRVNIEWGNARDGKPIQVEANCLMTDNFESTKLCSYAYAVCAFSLFASLVVSILLCVTCNLCGLGHWVEFAFSALGTAWWVIASAIFTGKSSDADDAKVPKQKERHAVVVLSWIVTLLFLVVAIICLVDAVSCLKSCVCCCCPDGDDEEKRRQQAEAKHEKQRQRMDKEKEQQYRASDPAAPPMRGPDPATAPQRA